LHFRSQPSKNCPSRDGARFRELLNISIRKYVLYLIVIIKICQITTITMPTLALHFGYYCSRMLSETVVFSNGYPIKDVFNANFYKEDMT